MKIDKELTKVFGLTTFFLIIENAYIFIYESQSTHLGTYFLSTWVAYLLMVGLIIVVNNAKIPSVVPMISPIPTDTVMTLVEQLPIVETIPEIESSSFVVGNDGENVTNEQIVEQKSETITDESIPKEPEKTDNS